jgi:hypothetical protein
MRHVKLPLRFDGLCCDDCSAVPEQFQNSNKEAPGEGEQRKAEKTKHSNSDPVCSPQLGTKAKVVMDEVACPDGTNQKQKAGCEPTSKHYYVDDDYTDET